MRASYRNYQLYKKVRQKFAIYAYGLLAIWLLLALIQWIFICLVDPVRELFEEASIACVFTFILAFFIFYFFVYVEKVRFINGINFLICILIVELQIISLFALVARVQWRDLLTFFVICVLLLFIFLYVSSLLPQRADLTLDVAVLFISAFFSLLGAIYILMYRFLITENKPSRFLSHGALEFLAFELYISLMILTFVMYHAQTINGNRFAEMQLNDFLLASVILFHDFLIIYWLTFYWQYKYKPFTSDEHQSPASDDEASTTSTENPRWNVF
ncbi:hypothetical protein KR093_010671 [Drosophila rubida]|uniref:Uncharacterized protein n=1 Tax=Drosophila rubida TaxID=30044 RepID=A0AAD4K3A8_9MUSC|nr:hypothetical protein KR093_010671 [Drosophila rubida]